MRLASAVQIYAREFSEPRREKLADQGKALPQGGFPIVNREDLKHAKQAIGRAKNRAATIRHINKRARALGAPGFGKKKKTVTAGGEGSGCRGENCGRHAGGKGTDKTHVPKQAVVYPKTEPKLEGAKRVIENELSRRRIDYDDKDLNKILGYLSGKKSSEEWNSLSQWHQGIIQSITRNKGSAAVELLRRSGLKI